MSKKKKVIIVLVIIVIAAIVAVFVLKDKLGGGSSSGDAAYVQSVGELMGTEGYGTQNRYSGVVETQDTWDVNLNADQTVKDIYVQVGDEVQVGTQLFSYDTQDLSLQISTAQLELEEIANEIKGYQSQIKALEAEKKTVSKDEQFNYTTQIQSLNVQIQQAQYEQQSKKLEIQKMQSTMDNSVVTSQIAGVVKSINENGTDAYGNSAAFISVLGTGDYRVKGTISENNVYMISEGQTVILRSRVDETQTWTGTISQIDTEETDSDSNSNYMYYDSGDSGESATKYPFYISLDDSTSLLLGQHVYIEMDEGQTEVQDGVWLYSGYIVFDDEGNTFCWTDNGNGKLEKRTVELGEYNADLDEYEILSGLAEEDLIAWPQNCFEEGMATTQNIDEAIYDDEEDYSEDEYVDDSSVYEEEYSDEYTDEEYIDDSDMTDTSDTVDDEGTYDENAGDAGVEEDTAQ